MSNPALESALSLKAQRRYTEAAQALRSHLAQNPADEEAQGLLMQIQELMMLELQIQQKLKRARGQLLEGDHAGARAIAEEILKMDGDHPEAKEILASAGGSAEPIDLQATMMDSTPVVSGSDFMLEAAAPATAPSDVVIGSSDFALAGPDDMMASASEAPLMDAGGFAAPAPAANLSAAENSKVRDFLTRGQAAIAAGNLQDAIDILTRVFIIDENNAEAQTLIDQARAQMDNAGAALDHEVNEAVGLFNAGDFMRAKTAFGEILKKSPNHAEALGYLGQIAQREHAQSAPALAADQSFEVDSGADAIPAAAPEEAPPPPPRAMPERPAPRPRGDDFGGAPAAVMAPSRPASSTAGVPGWAKGAAAALGLLALVILYFAFFKGGKKESAPAPLVASAPVVRSAPPPPPPASSAASAASAASAPAPVLDAHQLEIKALADGTDVTAMMTAAKKEFADRHYDDLKTLIASILDKQPNHGDALKLKDDALHQQVEEEEYNKSLQHAITLLNQTEYEESLRVGWTLRFPEERLKVADRLGLREQLMKVWSVADYNTAIKALHNQNVEQAETYLTDYIDANPKDAEAKKVMEIVKEYKVKALDKTYYTTIQGYQYKDTPK